MFQTVFTIATGLINPDLTTKTIPLQNGYEITASSECPVILETCEVILGQATQDRCVLGLKPIMRGLVAQSAQLGHPLQFQITHYNF